VTATSIIAAATQRTRMPVQWAPGWNCLDYGRTAASSRSRSRWAPPLTARQLEILRLIAHGHTNAAIAQQLFVTEGTIKWHVIQILAKTNSSNRAEAIARVLGTPQ